MGLVIFCGDVWVKVGSYSTIRQHWLEAEATRHEEEAGDWDAAHDIRTATAPPEHLLLPGTREILDSDDFEWSPWQARLMIRAINRLRGRLERLSPAHFDEAGTYYLEPVLRESVRSGMQVQTA